MIGGDNTLSINEIDVFYGDLQAIWKVSFVVNKGELVVIIGSNGAGKSTILKTLSGLLYPKSGSINFLGGNVTGLHPYELVGLGISHVPEGRRLFPYMTVQENLDLGAYTKAARKNRDEGLEEVYRLFPVLKERRDQMAETLSGGESQMLAIARGLMSKPKVLLMDEPSLGLSPKLVVLLFEMIKEIKERGITVLLVEQNVRNALELADRGYVLETGRITLEGKGEEILRSEHVKKAYIGL